MFCNSKILAGDDFALVAAATLKLGSLASLVKGLWGALSKGSMNRLQDPLDGMLDIYVDKQLQPLADPYFCYLQCTCNEGWIWKRKMRNVSEMWQVNCYMCGRPWKESFLDRLGFWYWDSRRRQRWCLPQWSSARRVVGLTKGPISPAKGLK